MRSLAAAVLISAALLASCRKAEESKRSEPPAIDADRAEFEATRRTIKRDVANDRAELVRPAPAGFKPEPVDRRLVLRLSVANESVSAGNPVMYRAELQNVGRSEIFFEDGPTSFFKSGSFSGAIKVFLKSADRMAKEVEVFDRLTAGTLPGEIMLPNRRFSNEKTRAEDFERFKQDARSAARLVVTLRSGEILVTRGKGPGQEFRPLRGDFDLRPGKYELRLELDDGPPSPPSESILSAMEKKGYSRAEILDHNAKIKAKSLGQVRSNPVRIRVAATEAEGAAALAGHSH